MRKILLLAAICLASFITGCIQTQLVPVPNKIVIWNDGQSKVITSTDKNFTEIVRLTNERIDKKQLSTAKDVVDDEYIDKLKKESLALEFIYDKQQKMLPKGYGFDSFKYHRLFFSLLNDKSGDQPTSFQHGDLDHYIEYSRGPLGHSPKLIDLVKSILI